MEYSFHVFETNEGYMVTSSRKALYNQAKRGKVLLKKPQTIEERMDLLERWGYTKVDEIPKKLDTLERATLFIEKACFYLNCREEDLKEMIQDNWYVPTGMSDVFSRLRLKVAFRVVELRSEVYEIA